VLNTVLASAVLQTLCWRSFGGTLLGTQSLEIACWNQGRHLSLIVDIGASRGERPQRAQSSKILSRSERLFS
jgi:hypothetical protein